MKPMYVVIEHTRGSAPRDAGTAMEVTATGTRGTIGGGALEHLAIAKARSLQAEAREARETLPLGPALGQCCGGAVTLRYTFAAHDIDEARFETPLPQPESAAPLWLWGAGHVGRAIVGQATPGIAALTWVDESPARFPDVCPDWVDMVVASDMPRLAAQADPAATHLIFTYSHEIDLALCDALLRRGPKGIGLIGSATKWARFQTRLCAMGHNTNEIARITCPIGDKSLGKHPNAIARGVLYGLVT